jgi:pimeloyl-ACP methyl ester carboxylesterase
MWDAQAAVLSARFLVLRYDTRGHGQSAHRAGPLAIEDLGRDVLALLDHLDIAKAALCGISMGALTAQSGAGEAAAEDRYDALAAQGGIAERPQRCDIDPR